MNYKSKKYSKKNNKFRNELCSNNMTFQDCELAILRNAVDETEKIKGEKITKNPNLL
jgi:ribosomal protein S18